MCETMSLKRKKSRVCSRAPEVPGLLELVFKRAQKSQIRKDLDPREGAWVPSRVCPSIWTYHDSSVDWEDTRVQSRASAVRESWWGSVLPGQPGKADAKFGLFLL